MHPHLVVAENNHLPVLIIDREGSIGLGLYAKLKDHLQVVLVGGREPEITHNLLFLELKEHIPSIPKDKYSHIFLITESEKDIRDLFPSCLQKAKEDKAKLIIAITERSVKEQTLLEILSSYEETSVLLVGDIFGSIFAAKKLNAVEEIFYEAKIRKSIKLYAVGLRKLYPVHYEDIIIEILKVAFGGKHAHNLFCLFCRYPITQLGLAHALQKVNPFIKIDFIEGEEEKERVIVQGGVYLLPETYPLFDKLYKAYSEYKNKGSEAEDNISREYEIKLNKKKSSQKSSPFFYAVFFCLIFISVSVLLPLVLTLLFAFEGKNLLLQAKNQMESGNSISARKSAVEAKNYFQFAEGTGNVLLWEIGLLGLQDKAFMLKDRLHTGESLALEIERASSAIETLKNITAGFSLHPQEDARAAAGDLKQILTASESFVQNPNLPVDIRQEIGKQLESTAVFANIIDGLPAFLAADGKKTYAVLFQNNMELRPGGGFIGSYGLLTLDKGKIADFSIHDVYDADGQLKGHVEPPFQIRRYLPSAHWYFRDSNFDVDFLKNASQVAFFLQLETGKQIDGVVGTDLSFVKSIVQALGGVTVPEYALTVTPENFFQETESHAEKNFFPGSSQKKDFLRNLFEAISSKIAIGNISYAKLISAAAISAREKHLLFAFADKPSQDLFTVNGLSSSLWDPRSQEDGKINDFLGINEANLGANKVNYYVKRSVDQRVVVNDIGDVSEQLEIDYENDSKNEYPGGDYKNYLRIILPQNSSLIKIMIDGQNQSIVPAIEDFKLYEAKNFIPPSGLELARQDEENKSVYGFLVNIAPGSKKTVTIIYVLPQKLNMNKILQHYNFVYFKQPGTDSYQYNFSLSYPSSIKAVNIAPGFLNQGTQVVYSGQITEDLKGDISLSRK